MSLPKDFQLRLFNTWTEIEYQSFIMAMSEPPPTSIRLHPEKYTKEIPANKIPWCRYGYYLDYRPKFTLDPDFHTGSYYVQEASSQSIEYILSHIHQGNTDIKILDLCGAPGGKSTLAATYLSHDGLLVANEVIKNRAYILRQNIIKEGYSNVVVSNNDPSDFGRLEGFFDVIIVDAPCSGEGMFRKDIKSMDEWSLDNVALCSARQKRILHDVLPSLKTDGHIIYSTCTYNDDENIDNVEYITQEHNLESVPIPFDPDWNIIPIEKGDAKGYQFYPHKIQGEGFFVACLRKKNDKLECTSYPKTYKNIMVPSKKEVQEIEKYIIAKNHEIVLDKVQTFRALPEGYAKDIKLLADSLRVIHCGTALGTLQKSVFIPDHNLSTSLKVSHKFPTIELTESEALRYLKRELTEINSPDKGWQMATYRGNGLGFLKNLGNRINNYLPQELRIRMDIEQ